MIVVAASAVPTAKSGASSLNPRINVIRMEVSPVLSC
jgi:hypothetical protein